MTEPLDRYSRQVRFPQLGESGQRALLKSRVTLCGCGALGTVLANHLARAGVGMIRIIDRDFIETHNLQRQILFDEADVADNLPKAEAAARKLRAINSTITVEPVVTDHRPHQYPRPGRRRRLDPGRDRQLRDALPDQRCGGQAGQAVDLRRGDRQRRADDDDHPGQDAVLAVPDRDRPPPGMTPTCETAGVLGPAVAVIASFEAIEAIKLLAGAVRRPQRPADHGRHLGLDLPAAQGGRTARQGGLPLLRAAAIRMARRDAWARTRPPSAAATRSRSPSVAPSPWTSPSWPRRLRPLGEVRHNAFMLRFATEGYEFTVFPDGRAIIKGTNDIAKARTLYAQFVGS